MKEQHYKNHNRYIPLWHLIIPLVILSLLVGSIINLARSEASHRFAASLLVVIAILFSGFYWYTRWFALRAQDRAIRAEEHFRHYILTGKPMDGRLRLSQIIALRFASDEEMPGLAQKAAEEHLSSKQIKQAIKSWKADHHRA